MIFEKCRLGLHGIKRNPDCHPIFTEHVLAKRRNTVQNMSHCRRNSFMTSTRVRLIFMLSISQIFGWGTSFDLLGVLGRIIAADIGLSTEVGFLGATVMLLIMGFAGPLSGRLLEKHGAAKVMGCGSVVFAIGLAALSQAHGPVLYFISWFILGTAGTLTLSVAAYSAVVEREGANAKRVIGVLMIFTGLSTTLCWPLASWLNGMMGWRDTVLIGAGVHLLVLTPLHLFGLPAIKARSQADKANADRAPMILTETQQKLAMIAFAIIALGFSGLTFGISSSLIAMLQQAGATPLLALQLASFRSVLGISARATDTLAGKRASPMLSGLIATALIIIGFLALALGNGSTVMLGLFIGAYGMGSGLSVIARTVLPLSFFSASQFAGISAKLALPGNISNALSPVIIAALFDRGGLPLVLGFTLAVSSLVLAALMTLVVIARRSRDVAVAAA
jgi:MFS family permease